MPVTPGTIRRRAKLEAWIDLLASLGWSVIALTTRESLQVNPPARQDLVARGLTVPDNTSVDLSNLANQLAPDVVLFDSAAGLLIWQPRSLDQVSKSRPTTKPLTPRETEIWRLLQQGKTSEEIAVILQRSRRTVEKHQQALYRKLGVQRADQAILFPRP